MAGDGTARDLIQAPKLAPLIMRYELSDYEWSAIKPMLPNKPRGVDPAQMPGGFSIALISSAPRGCLDRCKRSPQQKA